VAEAWEEGCPVAGQHQDAFEETADIAIRRWDSFERRHRRRLGYPGRVEDLAKGLRDRFERDPKLTGRVMEDYRYLASRIAEALTTGT
jgi:hypothetical protein